MYPCIHVSIFLCLYVSKMLQNSFENGPKFVKNGPKSMENGPKFIKNQPKSIPEVTLSIPEVTLGSLGAPCVDFGPFRREMAHPWPPPWGPNWGHFGTFSDIFGVFLACVF